MQANMGINIKLNNADGRRLPTEQIPVNKSPSTLFVIRTTIDKSAGIPQARTWKYDERPSIDSCAHLRFAARNHAKHNITHHILLAILKATFTINIPFRWR